MKKLGLRFSPRARLELYEIRSYLNKEASPDIARQQVKRIKNAVDRLRSFPEIGVLSHSYVGPCRRWFASSYVILYMSDEKSLSILHILHGSQDQHLYIEAQ